MFGRMIPSADTNFTVPFAPIVDPSSILLHFDGATGGAILDATGRHTVTAAGFAQIVTTNQRFGNGACSFNGFAGTYIQTQDNLSDFYIGGDFYFDFWTFLNANNAHFFHSDPSLSVVNRYFLNIDSFNFVNWSINGATVLSSSLTLSMGVWTHIEIGRSGNTTTLLINGVPDGTYVGTEILAVGSAFVIGARADGAGFNLNGLIDEFHGVKGVAGHTAAFTLRNNPYLPPPPY